MHSQYQYQIIRKELNWMRIVTFALESHSGTPLSIMLCRFQGCRSFFCKETVGERYNLRQGKKRCVPMHFLARPTQQKERRGGAQVLMSFPWTDILISGLINNYTKFMYSILFNRQQGNWRCVSVSRFQYKRIILFIVC